LRERRFGKERFEKELFKKLVSGKGVSKHEAKERLWFPQSLLPFNS